MQMTYDLTVYRNGGVEVDIDTFHSGERPRLDHGVPIRYTVTSHLHSLLVTMSKHDLAPLSYVSRVHPQTCL